MRSTVLTLLITVFFSGAVFADRPLEEEEIVQIFETLTSQPKKTWIPSGTICADHEEYKAPAAKVESEEITERINQKVNAYLVKPNKINPNKKHQQMKLEAIPYNVRYQLSNEYTMSSNVIVRFDGSRFYWEINVNSRVDSMQPPADLADNSFAEKFDLDWNKKRVFAWDGQKYTNYFRPGNQAIITATPGNVNGPLTAGIIPWGHGRYSYESLSKAQSSAIEVESNGQSEIQLTVINDNRRETFVLDPERQYALKSSSLIVENTSMTVCNYANYQLVGKSWCPGNIVIEKYDTTTRPPRLIAQDIWDFTSVSNGTLEPGSFDVDFEYDALIEDHVRDGEPLQFRYKPPQEPSVRDVNIDVLMRNRLEIACSPELQGQNCATVSLKYVCEKLGCNLSWKELTQLVHGQEKSTTMLQIQQFVYNLGLNSLAVKTDLKTLKTYGDCQIILHLPRTNHYVVLGDIDDEYVRLIDLNKNSFYYRNRADYFSTIWNGTALIVSDRPVDMKNRFARIDDNRLRKIMGADNCQTCSNCIQGHAESPCPDMSAYGYCGGVHTIYYRRYGCESASAGNCVESNMVGSIYEACGYGTYPDECVGSGDWTSSYISACK